VVGWSSSLHYDYHALLDLIGEERVLGLIGEEQVVRDLVQRKGAQWLRAMLERFV
jgi:hypothetical protein